MNTASKSSRRDLLLKGAAAAAAGVAVATSARAQDAAMTNMAKPTTAEEKRKDAEARSAIAGLQKIDPNISYEWTKSASPAMRMDGKRRIVQFTG